MGFAHDSKTGRAVFEAFIAVRTPFAVDRGAARASFQGKEPGTLEAILGRAFEPRILAERIAESYVALAGGVARDLPLTEPEPEPGEGLLRAEPPWSARLDEAIGPVCAGRDAGGVLRLGGDFMASRDAIADVEARVGALSGKASPQEVSEIVNDAFRPPAATLGVKDLGSLARVLLAAQP